MIRRFALSFVALTLAVSSGRMHAQNPAFDLLIRQAKVFDGTGNPWFIADVGVKDGRIIQVGALGTATAAKTIDARGKYLAPGFIDIHSHAAWGAPIA
jgi:N-acyl-D-amino-acid deacylase